jgi:hypothetical protein
MAIKGRRFTEHEGVAKARQEAAMNTARRWRQRYAGAALGGLEYFGQDGR